MRVKLCSRCPYAPRDLADHYDPDAALLCMCEVRQRIGGPQPEWPMRGQEETDNAQQVSTSPARSRQALRRLRRKVWPHPSLLLADCRLFEKMPRSIQGPQGERHRMAVPISRRLTTVSIAAA